MSFFYILRTEDVFSGYSGGSSTTSSIGKSSGLSDKEDEVESELNGGTLSSMEALEEALPVRRGLSEFYKGKSKSYTSLENFESISDIAKPDDSFKRRRRSVVANNTRERNTNFSHRRRISKKPIRSSLAANSSDRAIDDAKSSFNSKSPSLVPVPMHPRPSITNITH